VLVVVWGFSDELWLFCVRWLIVWWNLLGIKSGNACWVLGGCLFGGACLVFAVLVGLGFPICLVSVVFVVVVRFSMLLVG